MSHPVLREARSRAEEVAPQVSRQALLDRYDCVRSFTLKLCEPLAPEDMLLQAMADVSPTKWHLAHTTWFFERFVLMEHRAGYQACDPQYDFLFNSYYQTLGPMHARPRRGLLSRPSSEEVRDYRSEVDSRLCEFITSCDDGVFADIEPLVTLGCHHEQQHQELILSDIKYNLFCNPLLPAYHVPQAAEVPASLAAPAWVSFAGGLREIGASGIGFAFDNEMPRHSTFLEPFALASRLVTNGEYRAFVEDGGYRRPELWLDLGFGIVQERGWEHPQYWIPEGDRQFTLGGSLPRIDAEPVCHLSFVEADAYARWSGHRLPTESEWEVAAAESEVTGNFAASGRFHVSTAAGDAGDSLQQLFGDVWEWTASPYVGYPGYRPPSGAIGEYNGKFMCNQYVLRGGSCATPEGHVRATYRNFFPADARWQFAGLRLAADA